VNTIQHECETTVCGCAATECLINLATLLIIFVLTRWLDRVQVMVPVPGFVLPAVQQERTMDEEYELIDLGDAKEETQFGHFFPPTDGINEYFY
jgi:hypothetical protein